MAQKPTYKAIVLATNKEITVYRLNSGLWCNYEDCRTTYADSELKILS